MSDAIQEVVIVGGGTAGWLTAGILAADHCAHLPDGLQVTLIESPRVPILGVGEGTWPSMRDTLRRIGLRESEFIKRCSASFKQGSRFNGWHNGTPGDSYFHPFSAPPDPDNVDFLSLWAAAGDDVSFAEAVTPQIAVCRESLAPKQRGTPEFAGVTNYAYHLDAPAFAEMLKEHCTEKLGVRYTSDDVVGVNREACGTVYALQTRCHGDISGDLFIDCTGGRALLIGDVMDSPLTDVSEYLFNDAALATHVPYPDSASTILSQTDGTAQSVGWIWDIALQSRRGIGHVFSLNHSSEEEARKRLAAYIEKICESSPEHAEEARLLRFRSGYRAEPWRRNIVAIGMSSGFVEPLEASAIVMIELSATMLSDTLPRHRSLMESSASRFNQKFSYRWRRIVEFLKLHYILSERPERYWLEHRNQETWPPGLAASLERWRLEPPSREDFPQAREIFPAASYAYVLYGMNFATSPPPTRRRRDDQAMLRTQLHNTKAMARSYVAGLPQNRDLLDHICENGLPRV